MTSSVVNKTVVLLTTSFPYGTGEQFIETEINYLADMASRVFIVPMKIEGISRPTPTNVTVIKELAQRNSRTGPIGKLLHALWLVLLSPLDLRFNLRYLSSLLIAAYYRNLTWQFFNDLLSRGLVRCEGTIFYSYWFSPEVAGIVKIKGQRRDLVVVTRAHGSDLYASAKQLPEFPFRKAIISQLDAVFCISSHGQAYLEERYGAKNIVLSQAWEPGAS